MTSPPNRTDIVIVGGGIIGCSVAYHLTQLGISDVVLFERKQLTSGTTWHAAGLVGQLRASKNMTRLAQYSTELFARLASETGQETGFRTTGSLTLALNDDRLEELKRQATMAHAFDVNCQLIGPEYVRERWPGVNIDDLKGGVYLPDDGQTNPVDTTLALAKGARKGNARIFEHTPVERLAFEGEKVVGVYLEDGSLVHARQVVITGGMWSRDFASQHNIHLPLHAAEHFYLVTEPLPSFTSERPTLRVPDEQAYYKYDAGKLLLGFFERHAKPWGMEGIPQDFCFDSLPEDLAHIEPMLDQATQRFPELADAGIQLFFNGPESFTVDDRYLLGEIPEVHNLFVACGFNSIGIQSSGGAGKVLAQWMCDEKPPIDLWDVDIRRTFSFQAETKFLRERTQETLGLLYAMHWPHRQYTTSRNKRVGPLHEILLGQGAVMGELAGWERPNWYAHAGQSSYQYTYGKPNWFDASQSECEAATNNVALFDQSSYPVFWVTGPDALSCLQYLSANQIDVAVGQIVYTQWLNPDGGIEADVTITRTGFDNFMVVTPCASERRDRAWLKRHARRFDCRIQQDHDTVIIGVMGPKSTQLLSRVLINGSAIEALPYYRSGEYRSDNISIRANRLSYVGERGYELYVHSDNAVTLWKNLMAHGTRLGILPAGFHAMNACRIEKGYRHWGHDIHDHITPLQSGLSFAVAWDKSDFIGRTALVQQQGLQKRRLVHLAIDSNEAPFMIHDEPVFRDGEAVGWTTSAAWGHRVDKSLAIADLSHDEGVTRDWLASGSFEVEVALQRYPITVQLAPFYDPKSLRMKD